MASYESVLTEAAPRESSYISRAARYLGGAAGAACLVALGAVLAQNTGSVGTGVRVAGSVGLAKALEGACPLPEGNLTYRGWCNESAERQDYLTYRDCDGDGILDPYCEGGNLLRFGYISSANGCKDNWPNGVCTREEAQEGMQSTGRHAASNEITIIHFNDVYNVAGVLEGDIRSGGLSRAAFQVQKERERNPDRTFVTFAGDLLSPSTLSALFKGEQMIDTFNKMDLDAAALGNHEFDFGLDVLYQRLSESTFPWVNINLMDEHKQLLNHTTKFVAKDVPWAPRWPREDGAKDLTSRVCFFGVAYDVRESLSKDVDRINFKDVFTASEEMVKELREQQGCNIVVPLTHQFSADDCKLSKQLGKDVDLILGGHDHTTEYTTVCGHAPYAKAASDLKTQWIMTLWLSDDGSIESIDSRLISLTDADRFDQDIHDMVVGWEEKAELKLDERIGCFETPMEATGSLVRSEETNTGNLFTDALRAAHGTDVAMYNGGGIRGNKVFSAGRVSKKTVFAMHPFNNVVIRIYATGKQLKDYINDNLRCIQDMCGNFVHVSGLKYEFDSSAPKDKRLVKLMMPDGSEVPDDEELTVAIDVYSFAMSALKKNKLYHMVTTNDALPLVDAVIDYIQAADAKGKCYEGKKDGRIVDVASETDSSL